MKERHTVVIAEDQTIVRKGLCLLLGADDGLEVVGEAENGIEAIRAVQAHTPDLLLIDLSMPKMNGIAAIREVKKQYPATRVLALTIHKSDDHILAAFKAGADGYCVKDAPREELLGAVKGILSGKAQISPEVAGTVLEGYIEGRKQLKSKSTWDTLTQRQKEVLKLIGEGYKSKEIADHLCISWRTVEKHRANIMDKLDLHTASALTAYAIRKGLVGQ